MTTASFRRLIWNKGGRPSRQGSAVAISSYCFFVARRSSNFASCNTRSTASETSCQMVVPRLTASTCSSRQVARFTNRLGLTTVSVLGMGRTVGETRVGCQAHGQSKLLRLDERTRLRMR